MCVCCFISKSGYNSHANGRKHCDRRYFASITFLHWHQLDYTEVTKRPLFLIWVSSLFSLSVQLQPQSNLPIGSIVPLICSNARLHTLPTSSFANFVYCILSFVCLKRFLFLSCFCLRLHCVSKDSVCIFFWSRFHFIRIIFFVFRTIISQLTLD